MLVCVWLLRLGDVYVCVGCSCMRAFMCVCVCVCVNMYACESVCVGVYLCLVYVRVCDGEFG